MITKKLKHVTYTIEQDQNPWNPREDFDTLASIALANNHYLSGDENLTDDLLHSIQHNRQIEYLPIYAYIHSGILLDTTPFSCPWDSGHIGFIYVNKDTIQKEFNVIKWRKHAKQLLQAEFDTFKLFIEGNTYLVTIKDRYTGDILDTCSYLDTIDQIKKDADTNAEYYNNLQAETYNRIITEVN
jgi:hypothetical protein